MPKAARLNDSVAGTTAGEHTGHVHPHSPEPFGGQISGGCSGNVFINGRPGGYRRERHNGDGRLLPGSSQGAVAAGSGSVNINGKPAARMGDTLAAHSGAGAVASGSSDVFIGG